MTWFRKYIKTGAKLALFALAVQIVLSFAHVHPVAAPATAAQADRVADRTIAAADAIDEAIHKQRRNHDGDRQPADACAICAVMSLANNFLFASPPVLLLPEAIDLLRRAIYAEFRYLHSAPSPFHSRAPPLS